MIYPSADPELVDSDAARKCAAGTSTIQDWATKSLVNFEQNPIQFVV